MRNIYCSIINIFTIDILYSDLFLYTRSFSNECLPEETGFISVLVLPKAKRGQT